MTASEGTCRRKESETSQFRHYAHVAAFMPSPSWYFLSAIINGSETGRVTCLGEGNVRPSQAETFGSLFSTEGTGICVCQTQSLFSN